MTRKSTRKPLIYASLIVVFALFLSAGLLQLTQSTVQSAQLEEVGPPPNEFYYTLHLEKSLKADDTPSEDWKFEIVGGGIYTETTLPALGGTTSISLPIGAYTITEVAQAGYKVIGSECISEQAYAAGRRPMEPPSRTLNFMIDGADANCYYANGQTVDVNVVKNAVPDSSQPFTISALTLEAQIPEYMTLVDDGNGISNTYTYKAHDGFQLQEGDPGNGWIPVSSDCVHSSSEITDLVQLEPYRLQLPTVHWDGIYTCTFTNTQPSLLITKTVGTEPDVCATTDEIDVFTGDIVYYCYQIQNTSLVSLVDNAAVDDQFGTLSPAPSKIKPLEYINSVAAHMTISKAVDASVTNVVTWTAAYSGSPDSVVPLYIPVTATDSARVNVYDPSRIIVKKVTLPTDDEQEFGFMLAEEGGSSTSFTVTSASGYESPLLLPGVYSVTEQLIQEGWMTVGEPTCVDGEGQFYDVSDIQLPQGVTVTCTFTNAKQALIRVNKSTSPETTDVYFDFTISGDAYTETFSLAHNTPTYESDWLMPGSYSLTEADKDQWTLESVHCSDNQPSDGLTLEYGDEVLCVFANKSTPTALDDIDYPDLDMQQLLPFMGVSE